MLQRVCEELKRGLNRETSLVLFLVTLMATRLDLWTGICFVGITYATFTYRFGDIPSSFDHGGKNDCSEDEGSADVNVTTQYERATAAVTSPLGIIIPCTVATALMVGSFGDVTSLEFLQLNNPLALDQAIMVALIPVAFSLPALSQQFRLMTCTAFVVAGIVAMAAFATPLPPLYRFIGYHDTTTASTSGNNSNTYNDINVNNVYNNNHDTNNPSSPFGFLPVAGGEIADRLSHPAIQVGITLSIFALAFERMTRESSVMIRSASFSEAFTICASLAAVSLYAIASTTVTYLIHDGSNSTIVTSDTILDAETVLPGVLLSAILTATAVSVLGWALCPRESNFSYAPVSSSPTVSSENVPVNGTKLVVFVATVIVPAALAFFAVLHRNLPGDGVAFAIRYLLLTGSHITLVVLWAALLAFTVFVIAPLAAQGLSRTIARKVYHILALLIMLPAISGGVPLTNFLGVSFAIALWGIVILEAFRTLRVLSPMFVPVDKFMRSMLDERQDCGVVLVSHIYLIVGLAAPIWLSMDAFRLPVTTMLASESSSEFFSMHQRGSLLAPLAGLLSTGVGDAFASAIGKTFGRHKWGGGSSKTIEGTIAAFVAMVITAHFCKIHVLGASSIEFTEIACIAASALLEAWTNQIDNLVLPAFLYATFVTLC